MPGQYRLQRHPVPDLTIHLRLLDQWAAHQLQSLNQSKNVSISVSGVCWTSTGEVLRANLVTGPVIILRPVSRLLIKSSQWVGRLLSGGWLLKEGLSVVYSTG